MGRICSETLTLMKVILIQTLKTILATMMEEMDMTPMGHWMRRMVALDRPSTGDHHPLTLVGVGADEDVVEEEEDGGEVLCSKTEGPEIKLRGELGDQRCRCMESLFSE